MAEAAPVVLDHADPTRHLGLLKLDIMLRGIRLEAGLPRIERREIELRLSDGRRVSAPLRPDDADTPYLLRRIESGEDRFALDCPTVSVPVSVYLHQEFYDSETHSGMRMGRFGEIRGRYLALTPAAGCLLLANKQACMFCGQHGTAAPVSVQASVDDVLDAVARAQGLAGIEAVFLTVGYTREEDAGIAVLEPYIRAIKKRFDILVAVDAIPPEDNAWIDRTYAMGVDTLAYNLEVWDPQRFEEVCPGLHSSVGRERYLEALSYATSVFPNGAVISHLIVGLESPQSTMAGIDGLTGAGVVPVLPVCRPFQGKDLRPERVPQLAEMVPVYAHLGRSLERHKLRLGWVREMSVQLSSDDAKAMAGRRPGLLSRLFPSTPRLHARLSDLRRNLRVQELPGEE